MLTKEVAVMVIVRTKQPPQRDINNNNNFENNSSKKGYVCHAYSKALATPSAIRSLASQDSFLLNSSLSE